MNAGIVRSIVCVRETFFRFRRLMQGIIDGKKVRHISSTLVSDESQVTHFRYLDNAKAFCSRNLGRFPLLLGKLPLFDRNYIVACFVGQRFRVPL